MTVASVSADGAVALRAGECHQDDAKLFGFLGGMVSPTSGRLQSAPCARSQAVADDQAASRLLHLSVAVLVMARAMRRANRKDRERLKALLEA